MCRGHRYSSSSRGWEAGTGGKGGKKAISSGSTPINKEILTYYARICAVVGKGRQGTQGTFRRPQRLFRWRRVTVVYIHFIYIYM